MSIGLNKVKVIGLSALAGSLFNLPISCFLTARLGVAGVIWGTILTTLFSNFLVPGIYVFRVLEIDPRSYLRRTLIAPLAGGVSLIVMTWVLRQLMPNANAGPAPWSRALSLVLHLSVGTIAYLAGYLLVPGGRADFWDLFTRLRRR
jgi:O-antigen/teichoic acid export membrane protein